MGSVEEHCGTAYTVFPTDANASKASVLATFGPGKHIFKSLDGNTDRLSRLSRLSHHHQGSCIKRPLSFQLNSDLSRFLSSKTC